mgnify:FL=1
MDRSGSPALPAPVSPWAVAALMLAALAIIIIKGNGAARLPQLWAEDALVFFAQARTLGLESSIRPSAG